MINLCNDIGKNPSKATVRNMVRQEVIVARYCSEHGRSTLDLQGRTLSQTGKAGRQYANIKSDFVVRGAVTQPPRTPGSLPWAYAYISEDSIFYHYMRSSCIL